MARSKSDISNSAIRIFLQDVGKFYDRERGFEPFSPNLGQKDQLLEFFGHRCCFCWTEIDRSSLSQDHLIPMNKAHLGLHAWGNVVPCCRSCNNEKQQKPWREFLNKKAGPNLAKERCQLIDTFVSKMRYDPALNLHQYADNLHHALGHYRLATQLWPKQYRQSFGASGHPSRLRAGSSVRSRKKCRNKCRTKRYTEAFIYRRAAY